jgi:4-hydroxy-tetrahydrodipicolinate synthase
MRTAFTGCGTALVTPFTSSGAVDEAAVRRLAKRQVEAGIHFLVPCGTTGEAPTLRAAEVAGRVPVLAGAGGYDTREVIEAAKEMQSAGASGLLSVTPYYNKPTPDGLVRHYQAIAEATPLPIVVYNVPGRTGCNVDPATLARLTTIPHLVAVKEASGNMTQICEVMRAVPPEFIVLSGDDALTLPAMAVGARGIVSVASNELPAEMTQLVEAAEANDFTYAREIHTRLLPLMLANFAESNPIPVKCVMAQMGLLEESYRLPMVPPRAETRDKLAKILASVAPATVQA